MARIAYSPRRSLVFAAAAIMPLLIAWLGAPLIIRDALPLCIFRIATGLPCPFCGLTRAIACAMHGDLAAAWMYNPLWVPITASLVATAALCTYDAVAHEHLAENWLRWIGSKWVWITIGLAVFGVARIVWT